MGGSCQGERGRQKAVKELGHPTAQFSSNTGTPDDKSRLDREGSLRRRGPGDTYLINWPRSSHRVSQPGHLHSPCP